MGIALQLTAGEILLLWPTISFWTGWEIAGAALVAIGCIGEWYLFKKDTGEPHNTKHRKAELWYITAVAVGVSMEFIGLFHSIPEAAALQKDVQDSKQIVASNEMQVAVLTATNLLLRSNVLALEAANDQLKQRTEKLEPRRIKQEDKSKLLQLLSKVPKTAFAVNVDPNSDDAVGLAEDLIPVMRRAGFVYLGNEVINRGTALPNHGIAVSITGSTNHPTELIDALRAIGLEAHGGTVFSPVAMFGRTLNLSNGVVYLDMGIR